MFLNGAYAQSAALRIINGTKCDAYLNVWASSVTLGNSNPCDISTCTIVVPAASTYVWNDPNVLFSGGGTVVVGTGSASTAFCGMATPLFTGFWPVTDWIWTDAEIQFSCPSPLCTEGGCTIGAATSGCVGTPGPCLSGTPSWSATNCTPQLNGVNWISGASCFMDDITINIF